MNEALIFLNRKAFLKKKKKKKKKETKLEFY